MSNAKIIVAGSVMVLLQAILSDKDVVGSYWIISEEWEDVEAQVSLQLIVSCGSRFVDFV